MKKVLFITFLLIAVCLQAKSFKVLEFTELPADFYAQSNPAHDRNMEYCAAIKLEGNYPSDMKFQEKIFARKTKDNSTYFFISAENNIITLTAPNFTTYTLDIENRLGTSLKKGSVYALRLQTLKSTKYNVKIKSEPSSAKIILDDEISVKSGQNIQILPGMHTISAEHKDYQNQTNTYNINENNQIINIILQPDFGWLDYKVIPSDASLKINGIALRSQDKIKMPSGNYKAVVTHPNFTRKTENFKIESGKTFSHIFSPQDSETPESTDLSQTIRDIRFTIIEAKYEGNEILVVTEVTDIKADRKLKLLGKDSKIYDDRGNEYLFENHKIANKKPRYRYNININLIKDVTVKHTLRLEPKVSEVINEIPKIIFSCETNDEKFEVIFRNLPVME